MNFRSSSFWYLLGELVSKGLPFLLLPYLTRKLGVESFGDLAYTLSIVAVVMVFLSLSQEAAMMSYYYKKGKYGLKHLLVSGTIINLVMSLTMMLILSFFIQNVDLVISLASVSVFYSLFLASMQAQQRVKWYVVIQISYSILMVVSTIYFLENFSYATLDRVRLDSLIFSYSVIILPFVFFILRSFDKTKIKLLKKYLLYILGYGLPLLLHQLGIYVKGQLDRVFIYQNYSSSELGIYSAGVQLAMVLTVVLLAINKALVPSYYQALRNNILFVSKIKRYALLGGIMSFIPAIIAFIIPNNIYVWFLGDVFAESKYYVVAYLLGLGLTIPYLVMVNYFFYHGYNGIISKVTLASAFIYLVLLITFSSMKLEYVPFALYASNLVICGCLYYYLSVFNNGEEK